TSSSATTTRTRLACSGSPTVGVCTRVEALIPDTRRCPNSLVMLARRRKSAGQKFQLAGSPASLRAGARSGRVSCSHAHADGPSWSGCCRPQGETCARCAHPAALLASVADRNARRVHRTNPHRRDWTPERADKRREHHGTQTLISVAG